jgi:hypothetical protein
LLACLAGIAGCGEDTFPSLPTRAPVALGPVEVTSVGDIPQGGSSDMPLVLRFTEVEPRAITSGEGSFQVTLTDHAGRPDTLRFDGTPTVEGPGSLAASAALTRGNVLTISIVDSDPLNIESVAIGGLTIVAGPTAAVGPINALIGGCSGSLAGCTASNVLPSPGTVVAGS